MKIAVIFGGAGFVGRSLARKLLAKNYRVKIVTRDKEKAASLKTFAAPEFLTVIEWNYRDEARLNNIISNADLVINLVGILAENKKGDFEKYHTELNRTIAQKCQQFHVQNLVYLSALGADKPSKSKYFASKINAEKAIFENFDNATILRPSIVFGTHDNFFNKFAAMCRKPFGILPLINNGTSKFQPIYVEDLTQIIAEIPENKKARHKIYEVGGAKVYSFKRLLELVASYCDRKVRFINLPFSCATILAFFVEIFTKKILTCDQVEMLKTDNIVTNDNLKKDFVINPKSVEEIVPNYIR